MMKIVYFKDTGKIQRAMDITNEMDMVFYHYPQEYKDNLDYIVEVEPKDIQNYMVENGELVKMSDIEINEMIEHGRLLSKEERLSYTLLKNITPSDLEIEQAKLMIALLPILKEVMLND